MEPQSDEIKSLRRATRDIIAISSLPSIWARYNVKQIAYSLVETLRGSLGLEFAYVSLNDGENVEEAAYARRGFLTSNGIDQIKAKLDDWLRPEGLSRTQCQIQDPFSDAKLQVSFVSIGMNFKEGVLVVGSAKQNFPSDTDRLILNIATNQLRVTIQHQWAQEKTRALLSVAEEREAKLRDAEVQLQAALIAAEQAKLLAESANELKSTFLANMSHEIRTPLGAILGFTDVLRTTKLTQAEQKQYLDIISRSGLSLTKIIDDILDISKVEAGKLEIENSPLLLTEVCREVLEMFADRATGKGISLVLEDRGLPHFPIGSDRTRIRQILVNLVGNAVKFTSQGSIKISAEYKELENGSVATRIFVTDSGIGMTDEAAANLFQAFNQGDNTTTRRFGGTGLGLALSKKLGQALGGDVAIVKCEVKKGCIFKFEFVAEKAESAQLAEIHGAACEARAAKPLEGFKVLVADDSVDNRVLMEIVLKQQGASVDFAEDGEESVEMALSSSYDAILMDIQMPVLDGYGALAKLRKENYRKPIIALTAHAMKEERNRAIASGFADHVPKPLKPRDIVDSILTHARRS